MGQALMDLATTLDFEFPSRELESAQLSNFVLLSTPPIDLDQVQGEEDADIDVGFSWDLLDSVNIPCDAALKGEVEIWFSTDEQRASLTLKVRQGKESLPQAPFPQMSLVVKPMYSPTTWSRVGVGFRFHLRLSMPLWEQ